MALCLLGLMSSTLSISAGCSGGSTGIHGTVSQSGQPVAAGRLILIHQESKVVHEAKIESGSYTIEGHVAPGDYQIRIRVEGGAATGKSKVTLEQKIEPDRDEYDFSIG